MFNIFSFQNATKIRDAVDKVLMGGKVRTRDLGGFATTFQFTDAVIRNL